MTDDRFHRSPDRGYSLIEVLVSVVILGTAGIAVLAALGAAATGAAVNREISSAQSALSTAGDAVTDVDVEHDTFVACATDPAPYQQLVDDALPEDGPVVVIRSIAFWDGDSYEPSCVSSAADRLQRITLETTDGDTVRSLAVVKRRGEAPTVNVAPLDPNAPGSSGPGEMVAPTPHPGL